MRKALPLVSFPGYPLTITGNVTVWTYPNAFSDLPAVAPQLLTELQKSNLVIFKGDVSRVLAALTREEGDIDPDLTARAAQLPEACQRCVVADNSFFRRSPRPASWSDRRPLATDLQGRHGCRATRGNGRACREGRPEVEG